MANLYKSFYQMSIAFVILIISKAFVILMSIAFVILIYD